MKIMKAIVQRVIKASVTVGECHVSSIGRGLCVLIGISTQDTQKDADYIVRKILNLRLFEDENGSTWTRSVMDKGLEVLCVSQFTLQCSLKGNKPDFHSAMPADVAQPFYNNILKQLRTAYKPELIKDGQFGSYMQVHIQNDGPVTICVESPAMCIDAKQLSKLEKEQQRKENTGTKGNSESSKHKGAPIVISEAEGQLPSEKAQADGDAEEPECVLVWEKKPTLKEERKAKSLQLPLSFYCDTSGDADSEPDRPKDFETELQKVQQAQSEIIRQERNSERCTAQPVTADNGRPINLSTKTQEAETPTDSNTTQDAPAFVYSSESTCTFADLAKNSGDFAFGKIDIGDTVFGSGAAACRNEDEDEEGNDVSSDDIHFQPIVSLPETSRTSSAVDFTLPFSSNNA